MVVRHRVTISVRSYAAVWAAEELGPQHPALLAPLHTDEVPPPERVLQAGAELSRAGLFDERAGGLHPDLRHTFRLLARPSVEFYGWIVTQRPAANLSALAAWDGDGAVLAVLDGDTLTLSPVRPAMLAEALVDRLPQTPPAHGRSVTAPANELETQHEPGAAFAGTTGSKTSSPAARALQRLAAAPRTAAAQLYVAARDGASRRARNPYPLNVLDLPDGRWFMQHANTSGQVWVTAAPASTQSLVARLGEMRRALN
ncbi:ESX secretion-associated protein EspG [Gandjariella thermophila]|uniref:ESX secretion-associated protein EspG n=1 Tax=Gandjariella thermophila TaxID=1931992 RepID=A0A4D4JGS3_9PSEU|nr:ESX secretion-associated protein EspG [Gandjariella thermophila]GDY33097.1 ESX secretion-associated protein EspG [Gandjariella thermophila]